jgi:primosomal protein N' (replication factor Y)
VGFPSEPGISPDKIKPITRIVDPVPAFDEDQLAFFAWIANYYLSPLGSVIHTAVPSQIKARIVRVLEPTEAGVDALAEREVADEQALVLREIIRRPGLTKRGLTTRLSDDLEGKVVHRVIEKLVKGQLASWGEREIAGVKREVRTVALTSSADEAIDRLSRAGKRMVALVRALEMRSGEADVAALLSEHGSSAREALNRLEQQGVVAYGVRQSTHALEDVPAQGASEPPPLNDDQLAALAAITGDDGAKPWLLFGVTGSGKTEVFLGAARHALDQGRQVCVLVPEIGLTPQLVGRFKARFGDDVAVLHSGLTPGDRLAHWRRIREGEARVAVGARSALFAPFRDLGLVVVDEEHDDSYKQDDGVRYNARDLAVVLGRRWSCPVVLASATPSLESWFNAQKERYGLLRLPKRATPRPVPEVRLVDMTEVPKDDDGKRPLFAPETLTAMRETLAGGGKVIALFNRRGYATLVQCGACGGTYECPNCGISMTLHRRSRVVSCHYCGLKRPYTETCPACGAPELEELGKGTERIEEVLQRELPGVPIGRMDADTTAVRGSHHKILEAFRTGETKVLVGTQIIAKGHDFPDVHLVVVVHADQGFRMPDFRASERTYALLVQAAGRAGRGDVAGRVLVQTWRKDHYALQELDDVTAFFKAEARLRHTMRYPPFFRLVLIRLDGADRRKVASAAQKLARMLKAEIKEAPVQVLGPSPAALPRLVGRWRFQIILRSNQLRAFRGYLERLRTPLLSAGGRGVRVAVDVDPRHLM